MRYARQATLFALLALANCDTGHDQDARPYVPLEDVPAAFGAQADGAPLRIEGSQVTLQRSALDKEFLLSPAVMMAGPAPITQYLRARIVHFRLADATLGLFDVNPQVVYSSPGAEKLVRTFEITASDDQTITFRWSGAFPDIDMREEYDASDMPEAAKHAPVLPITDAFLASMTVHGDTLELQQVARLVTGDTAHLVYRLSPIESPGELAPRLSTRQHGVGYFETQVVRPGDGGSDYYARRWDTRHGPITYSIVHGMPADAEQAIREGVLYWNTVAGYELVRVETGADPQSVPPWGHVLIRWVAHDRAGLALAAMQAHPLTGEILAAEIFLPSFWTKMGTMDAAADAAALAPRDSHETDSAGAMCGLAPDALARQLATDHGSRRGAMDLLRLVVAHEVGHTLGLRHNFAASMHTTFDTYRDLHAALGEYLQQPGHQGAQTASSVMDYLGGGEALLMGAHVKHAVLPYDKEAIAWGYGAENGPLPGGFFCTDIEARSPILGCKPFDTGRNPIDGSLGRVILARKGLAHRLINALVTLQAPEFSGDALSTAQIMGRAHMDVLSAPIFIGANAVLLDLQVSSDIQSRRTKATEDGISKVSDLTTSKRLKAWLDEVGGLPGFVFDAYGITDPQQPPQGWLREAVEREINSPDFGTGFTDGGHPYALSAAQIQAVRATAPRLASYLEQSALRDVIIGVTQLRPSFSEQDLDHPVPAQAPLGIYTYARNLVDAAWETPLTDLGAAIILARSDNGDETSALPAYTYRPDVRLAAVQLLNRRVFNSDTWGADQRDRVLLLLLQEMREVQENEDLASSPEGQAWLKDQLSVASALLALTH